MTHGSDWPFVSIVTPSYQQASFLRRTIDSVLAQEYPHIDYRVIDGGSTDGSLDVLRSYGDRVRWLSEPDGGQADAINKGLASARGDVLAYLNSDDVLLPGAVARVAELFRRHADWDMLYGDAWHVDADDGILGRYPTAAYSRARLLQDCCICQPAAFWRRHIAVRVGAFDTSLHLALDFDYWLRIDAAGGRIVHVPEVLACSRLHAQAKTLARRLDVFREIIAVSVRHAGAASFSQCLAYWHHRCRARAGGWPRLLRRVPNAEWWLALLQTRWQRHHGAALPFGADLLRSAGRRVVRCATQAAGKPAG